MKVTDMRLQLAKRYPNGIRGKPIASMPDDQVVAIYRSLIERKDPLIGKKHHSEKAPD